MAMLLAEQIRRLLMGGNRRFKRSSQSSLKQTNQARVQSDFQGNQVKGNAPAATFSQINSNQPLKMSEVKSGLLLCCLLAVCMVGLIGIILGTFNLIPHWVEVSSAGIAVLIGLILAFLQVA